MEGSYDRSHIHLTSYALLLSFYTCVKQHIMQQTKKEIFLAFLHYFILSQRKRRDKGDIPHYKAVGFQKLRIGQIHSQENIYIFIFLFFLKKKKGILCHSQCPRTYGNAPAVALKPLAFQVCITIVAYSGVSF